MKNKTFNKIIHFTKVVMLDNVVWVMPVSNMQRGRLAPSIKQYHV